MDYELLEQVVGELAELLPGSRVDKVVHAAEDSLVLVLYRPKKVHYLLLAPERSLPRFHLISRRPAGKPAPAGFFLSLRKHLTGSRLEGLRLLQEDRIVELRFTRQGCVHLLFFELTGSVTNIVLADDERRIVAVLFPVPPDAAEARVLLPGSIYHTPERRHRRTIAKGKVEPAEQGTEHRGSAPANAAAEAWFARRLEERETAALRRQLASAINKASARVERKLEAVAQDVAQAEKGDDFRIAGELILANKQLLGKGQSKTDLVGYDGRSVSLALDPMRTPAENASRYFQRYKKARAGLALMRERLAHVRGEAERLNVLRQELDGPADNTQLLAMRGELVRQGYIRDNSRKSPAAGEAPAQPYRTIDHDGWQILVGKSSAGNDYITMRLARPDDIWLHAEGMPGSHVLVRNPGKRDIPEGVLRKAASLAAYFSRGRGAAKVPVAYTKASMVRKPKGAAPGTVLLSSRKTVMVAPEPA